MNIIELIKEHNESKVLEANGKSFVKIFGKNIFNEVKQHVETLDADKEQEAASTVYEAVSLRVRELMRADNFSVLTGAGSSINLGGVTFSKGSLEDGGWVKMVFDGKPLLNDFEELKLKFEKTFTKKNYGVEDFITFLFRLEFAKNSGYVITEDVAEVKKAILNELKEKCILRDKDDKDKIIPYKTFIKRILSRPVNLRRTNLFTTNYDLVFETAMDGLGVIYVDGFIGGLKSFFHPESFNFDYYYPAATTEGNVSRMERVLHYYKIHGSLNWIESKNESYLNVYGIEKKDTEQISSDNVLIYPTPMKEQDTVGFPYSEMFRRLANTIQQPQSVLVTYGYSFGDAHINRIIFEALTIPSFQLLIVSYNWTEDIKKIYVQFKDEPSVGFIIGEEFANWKTFVSNILPDLPTQDLEEIYQMKRSRAKDSLKS